MPVLVRTVIATGYMLYPSTLLDIFQVDWKVPNSKLVEFQHYITAYARFPISRFDADSIFELSLPRWIIGWWKHLNLVDSILLTGIAVGLVANLCMMKRFAAVLRNANLVVIIISAVGCIFWFVEAPDPRFGTGFLIPFLWVLSITPSNKAKVLLEKAGPALYRVIWLFLFAAVTLYSGFRFLHFFREEQWMFPAGVEKISYQTIDCKGLQIHIPVFNRDACGSVPVPCSLDGCQGFQPRGQTIIHGFKNNN
jgi:hypothetical protein